jgi:hypothetical protein
LQAQVTIERVSVLEIRKNANPMTCEQVISNLPPDKAGRCVIRLASQFGAQLFADIWAAIAVGTACRRNYSDFKIMAWGQQDLSLQGGFANSIPGITALQLSNEVFAESTGGSVPIDQLEYEISIVRGGVLEQGPGKSRTLLEFDPQQSVAAKIQGRTESLAERTLLLRDLVLRFRGELELGHRNRGLVIQDKGDYAKFTDFITELHANAFKYTRQLRYEGRVLRGLRLIRLKAHLAASAKELLSRADSPVILEKYLTDIARHKGPFGLMEASVSDFGQGIVDHFNSSPRGRGYPVQSRRTLLHELIHERLSSSSDPAAGMGLPTVLNSARSLRAYVSVRTGEFWLGQGFYDPASKLELVDVSDRESTKVSGTHWQVLWPMGL